jgi:NADP-dependent 3-hydroxy acid dehydrogenase YdfG
VGVKHYNHRTAAITGAGSGLGRDISLGPAATTYRVLSVAIWDESLDFKHAPGGAITLSRFDMAVEV